MFDVTAGRKLARLSAPKGWKPIQAKRTLAGLEAIFFKTLLIIRQKFAK